MSINLENSYEIAKFLKSYILPKHPNNPMLIKLVNLDLKTYY